MCAAERDQLELDLRNVIAGRGAKRLPRKRTAPVDESKSTNISDVAQQPSTRHQWKLIAIPGAQRIWGTVGTTTQAAVTNALKQLTTIDVTQLTVKRKFNTAVNDPTRLHKWWFIVQGEEDLLQQVERARNTVAVQTAWKLEPAYMYENKDTAHQNGECTDRPTVAIDGESTPANDSFLSHNGILCFFLDANKQFTL